MDRVLVTGATGCIGKHTVDVLVRNGYRVDVLHRQASDLTRLSAYPEIRFMCVDMHKPFSIPFKVDGVIHCAGNVSHWSGHREEQWKDNVLATRNLIEATRHKNRGRFVFCSTGACKKTNWMSREEVLNYPSGYIRTKRLAELELIGDDIKYTILRPVVTLGRWDYNNYSGIYNYIAGGGKMVFPGRMNFVAATDVAEALVRHIKQTGRSTIEMCYGPHCTWLELFQSIAEYCGVEPPAKATPAWQLKAFATMCEMWSGVTGKEPILTREFLHLVEDDVQPPHGCLNTYTIKNMVEEEGEWLNSLD